MNVISKVVLVVFLFSIWYSEATIANTPFYKSDSDTSAFSRLNFFNNISNAAGLKILSEEKSSEKIQIRLWSSYSHSLAAQFLDITFDGKSSKVIWYVGWSDWGDDERKSRNAERWPCISEISRFQLHDHEFAACTLAIAEDHEIELIKNIIESTDFYEITLQPTEKRFQLDGSSFHAELLDSSNYRFVSYMGHHLRNHPNKEQINKVRELIYMWRKDSLE